MLFRSRRVVIAEDHPELRTLLLRWLRYDGYEVAAFDDGRRLAHGLWDGRLLDAGYPDLLITDQCLPERDGLAVVRDLRESGFRTPVLLMSAFADEALHRRARELEVSAVVDKPFDLDDFRSLVARLLGARR